MIGKTELQNALNISIDDEATSDEDITKDELKSIQRRFNQLLVRLEKLASEERDVDEE